MNLKKEKLKDEVLYRLKSKNSNKEILLSLWKYRNFTNKSISYYSYKMPFIKYNYKDIYDLDYYMKFFYHATDRTVRRIFR